MMRVVFQEIAMRAVKNDWCSVCGKRRQRTAKFWQTLNPFNKDANGFIKTREQILEEVAEERRAWLATPLVCRSCEEDTADG